MIRTLPNGSERTRKNPRTPEAVCSDPNTAERTRTGPEDTRSDPNVSERTRTGPEESRSVLKGLPEEARTGPGPPWPSAAPRCSSSAS